MSCKSSNNDAYYPPYSLNYINKTKVVYLEKKGDKRRKKEADPKSNIYKGSIPARISFWRGYDFLHRDF